MKLWRSYQFLQKCTLVHCTFDHRILHKYRGQCRNYSLFLSQQPCVSFRCTIPETNPEMDVFRIGTLLELIRDLATSLAADGKKVKVSVQQALGEGVFQVNKQAFFSCTNVYYTDATISAFS